MPGRLSARIRKFLQSRLAKVFTVLGLGMTGFWFIFVAVIGLLDQALIGLILGSDFPLFLHLLPFTLAYMHDLGIVLASLGLVLLFLPVTFTLLVGRKRKEVKSQVSDFVIHFICDTDLLTILGFLGLFIAFWGIWFFMHQAFLFYGEYTKGALELPIYVFLGLELPAVALHSIGEGLVMIGLITSSAVIAVRVLIVMLVELGWLSNE